MTSIDIKEYECGVTGPLAVGENRLIGLSIQLFCGSESTQRLHSLCEGAGVTHGQAIRKQRWGVGVLGVQVAADCFPSRAEPLWCPLWKWLFKYCIPAG